MLRHLITVEPVLFKFGIKRALQNFFKLRQKFAFF